jgi:hypothetical protein
VAECLKRLTLLAQTEFLSSIEVIVVDDGSTDLTPQVLADFARSQTSPPSNHEVQRMRWSFHKHPHNLGKGASIRTALGEASGTISVIQDADLEYHPRDLNKILSMQNAEAGRDASSRLNLFLVLGLAFLLRALLPGLAYLHSGDSNVFFTPDTQTYVVPAQELMSHHRFFANGAPEITRTPGYPLFLIPGLFLGHLVPITIFLQILLSCFTVYLVYRTALLVFGSQMMALAAAALYAVEPLSVLFTGVILSETLFTALSMLWVYFLLRYLSRPTLGDLLLSGAFLAGSVYVRPIGYWLPLIIASGLSARIVMNNSRDKRRLLAHLFGFLMVCLGLMVPWQIRNRRETGYSGFSAVAPYYMYFYDAASVLAAREGLPYYQVQQRLGYDDEHRYFSLHPEQQSWPIDQRLNYMNDEARHILLSSPLTYARIHLEGVVRVMLDPGAVDYLKFFNLYPKRGGLLGKVVDVGVPRLVGVLFVEHPLVFWSSALLLLLELPYLAFACLVFFFPPLIRQPRVIAIIAAAAYLVVMAGGPAAQERFRHPVMAIICVLAGYGFCRVLDSTSWRGLSSPSHNSVLLK